MSICLSGITRVSSMYLFRGLFRQHPTANVCAVAQYRKRLSPYHSEIHADSRTDRPRVRYMNSILDENDVPMEDGEVAWDSHTYDNDSSPVDAPQNGTIMRPGWSRISPRPTKAYLHKNTEAWNSRRCSCYLRNAMTGACSRLWSPLFFYTLFSTRNSSKINELHYKMVDTFREYTGMTRYDDSDSPYWEEPIQIVFLFV